MVLNTGFNYLHAIELPTPFPVGPTSVYLADTPGEPLTLIDTGPRTPDTRAALEEGLDRLGHALPDLERIVVTHAHVDHFGLAGDLADTSGAQLLTHPWNIPSLEGYGTDWELRTPFYAELLRQAAVPAEIRQAVSWVTRGMQQFARPVRVDTPLGEGDCLRLAGRDWHVLHTPGHSNGLICLYEPESRVLLSSDHLLADISSNPVVEPPPPGKAERTRSLVLYRQSLQRVAAMEISRALPSHGRVINNVARLVAGRLAFHERRMEQVLGALRNGAHTTWEVTQALFPGRSPFDTFLAVSEVVGHLDVLEMEGRIQGEGADGAIRWRLAGDAGA